MNYTVWIQPDESNAAQKRVRWVAEDFSIVGEVVALRGSAGTTASDVIQELESESRKTLVSFHIWEEHSEELEAAWQQAAETTKPKTPPKHQLQVLRDQHHICPNCVVYEACVVGQATLVAAAMLTTVNACLGYQPHEEI